MLPGINAEKRDELTGDRVLVLTVTVRQHLELGKWRGLSIQHKF